MVYVNSAIGFKLQVPRHPNPNRNAQRLLNRNQVALEFYVHELAESRHQSVFALTLG